jgi:hypothetical protein
VATRPTPTWVTHFTHIDHLDSIIVNGLLGDMAAGSGLLQREAGNPGIKAARRRLPVPIHPFGVVADYAPFYFAPRSPMMSAIVHGRVPQFGTDLTGLMYLVTTTQALVEAGLEVLATDRNARLEYAEFRQEADCDGLVDWGLMKETWWNDTLEYPDRSERRMAECLVHRCVPFELFRQIGVHGDAQAAAVRTVLMRHGKATPVHVRSTWYF